MSDGWFGVDLDGTLAHWDDHQSIYRIGKPIPAMVARVKQWLVEGRDVRIVTARVAGTGIDTDTTCFAYRQKVLIEQRCEKHQGTKLPVTATKDFQMITLWDDRCIQLEPNTGRRVDGKD